MGNSRKKAPGGCFSAPWERGEEKEIEENALLFLFRLSRGRKGRSAGPPPNRRRKKKDAERIPFLKRFFNGKVHKNSGKNRLFFCFVDYAPKDPEKSGPALGGMTARLRHRRTGQPECMLLPDTISCARL